MLIPNSSPSIRFTGRWAFDPNGTAITTAPGSTIELAFKGTYALLSFDMEFMQYPFPHLWISIDDGCKMEVPVDAYLRLEAKTDDNHYVKIIFKSSVEMQHRWYQPLVAKVAFKGFEADSGGFLPQDSRKTIEFIGDSITEGVWVDYERQPLPGNDTYNRPFQDDATATYAYQTAKLLNIKPYIMGYGAVGITKGGCGSVPKVSEAYPYYFNGVSAEPVNADITIINHGANDRANLDAYISQYYTFLKLVRKRNPDTKLVVLSPFCGFACNELNEMVNRYNNEEHDSVTYINTNGWIPVEPLHPTREGHLIVARHLSNELKKLFEKELSS